MSGFSFQLRSTVRHCIFSMLLGYCALAHLVAQQYAFHNNSQGLGNLNINAIAQDKDGYLWIGTQNGLYRYDGFDFHLTNKGQGLTGSSIQALFVDQDHHLWVATNAGIFFQHQDGRFEEIPLPSSNQQFKWSSASSFSSNSKGQITIAGSNGNYLLRSDSHEHWSASPLHLEGSSSSAIHAMSDGRIWYGCDDDLCLISNNQSYHMREKLHLPRERWDNIYSSRNGHLWLRSTQSLYEITPDLKRSIRHNLPTSNSAESSLQIAEDSREEMIAINGSTLAIQQGDQWRVISSHNGLPEAEISCIFVDRTGVLWIGTRGQGLIRWLGEDNWEGFTKAEGLISNNISATLRDNKGRLWIGSNAGLSYLPLGAKSAISFRGYTSANTIVRSLAQSNDGAIWAGSDQGILRIDPINLSTKSWKTPSINRILVDQRQIWIGSDDGLFLLHEDRLQATPERVTLPTNRPAKIKVTDLTMDRDGSLWVATHAGLYRYSNHIWTSIDPGLAGIVPELIVADGEERLWASGNFAGLVHLSIRNNRIIEAQHIYHPPLLSEHVLSLKIDHRGWLWVGQDAGLSVFNGQRWRGVNQRDGLLWNDCSLRGLYEDTDGSLWIATSGGLSHLINPESLMNRQSPTLAFAEVSYGADKLINNASPFHNQETLSIKMASLDYRFMPSSHLRYRLLGLSPSWQESEESSLLFANLKPGNYRFEAVSIGDLGMNASPISSFNFTIRPHWWQNQWVWAGITLFTVTLLIFVRAWFNPASKRQSPLEATLLQQKENIEIERAELLRVREQVRHLSDCDLLTGLWNQRIILERLRAEVDRSQRNHHTLSIMLINIDQFSLLNESYGRQSGDRILKELSRIFLRAIRSYDWVGRYGGGEFLIILPYTYGNVALARAESLRKVIDELRFPAGERTIGITTCIGVATGFLHSSEELMEAAATALLSAQSQGKNMIELVKLTADRQQEMLL